jgi:uncharacterized membrane protein
MTSKSPIVPAGAPRARIDALDVLRGVALVGMFVFHFTWDLGFFGLISERIPFSPAFMAFGHVVAATFLGLSGASLVLAMPDGRVRHAYWVRLALIVFWAAVITLGSYELMPESFIFFGILHCIALGSVVGLAFLRAPAALTIAIAGAVVLAPFVATSPRFDGPWLWWVGLGPTLPRTNDWRPVFPWLGFVLLGIATLRLALNRGWTDDWARWRATAGLPRLLAWGGRHSLLVYLVHQPVFLGIVWVMAQIATPSLPAQAVSDPFVTSCISQCVGTGAEAGLCTRVCGCISDEVRKRPDTWQRLVNDALSPVDRVEIDGYTKICVRQSQP